MDFAYTATFVVLGLIAARWAVQLWLGRLNRQAVLTQATEVPETFRTIIDAGTYQKSVHYTLAKNRLNEFEITYETVILLSILLSGVLSDWLGWWRGWFGISVWSMAGFFLATGLVATLPGLPVDWYAQFHLEQRFGFNTMTGRGWWLDRLKASLVTIALGYPLLVLVLGIIARAGSKWWFWAWASVVVFELVLLVLAPVFILPLFNKFTPLPEGSLRDRLFRLAERTTFPIGNIQLMDGSRRSRHSNAFFTGFGRFRKIVLFDTLVSQLNDAELEAVLGHEIAHYKKGHILKMLGFSALALLAAFYALSVLSRQDWFYRAFGFEPGSMAGALLLFAVLGGLATFWLAPLVNYWTRQWEYQADDFAARTIQTVDPLITALRKLNKENLSNLTPHPIYSRFYYSHPTLLERERALTASLLRHRDARDGILSAKDSRPECN